MRVRTFAALAPLIFAMAWVASGPAQAASPSFSCSKARSATERAICASPALATADRAHARLYANTVAKARRVSDANAVARVRQAERGVRSNRDACGTDAACIRAAYSTGNSKMTAFLKQLD